LPTATKPALTAAACAQQWNSTGIFCKSTSFNAKRNFLDSVSSNLGVAALKKVCVLCQSARPTSVSADGSTPLHYANFHNDAVILLAAGADVCARDNRGRTALHRWTARGLLNELPSLFPLIAADADLDAVDNDGNTCRQLLARRQLTIDPEKVEAARRDIAKARIDFVRYRALEVCIGLQSLRLDALQLCEILQFACGPVAPLIPFHIWWKTATSVKHFRLQ
jgi:hypothetical protein